MNFQFWQGWPRSNRILFFVLLTVFAAALLNMWVAYFVEPSPAINLQTIQEANLEEVAVDQFNKGPFNFIVKGNNYVILQRQLGTLLATSDEVAYAYLFVMAAFVIGMLAIITTLERFYYLIGMGFFVGFVTTLSPEVLAVFGSVGKTFTVVIMMLYGLASFWIFYFATTLSFTRRLLVFAVITLLLYLFIFFFATTEKPFLFLAAYSAEAGLIACGLFIVTVAHEIVAAFIFATTNNPRQTRSLNHFVIITLIYLVNLVLIYSVRFGFIRWNIITIDLFLLLTISGILGLWGIRQRQKTFGEIISADPYAVFAYLLTGAFAFATIGMFMYNANDTALSAISDIIIYAHIGFGVIFLFYIFSNFGSMLSQNMQVYKVVYSPNNMPYFTFRLAGLITCLALLFYNAWQVPVHNAISGYKNGLADVYMKIDNKRVAQAYYEEARTYGFRGHHSNYALANIEGSLFNAREENFFYGEASGRRPTEMSYLNWAQTFQTANENLQAIATLNEGAAKLKDHEAIENTLGLLYARTGQPDSALKYLSSSGSSANIIGLSAINRLPITGDSIVLSDDIITKANQLALANTSGKFLNYNFQLPADTSLSTAQTAAISNYLLNSRGNNDTTFVRKVMSLARRPSNDGFKEALLFASAINLYQQGETRSAFTALEEVTVMSQHQGRYNNILAMWALENDEPQRALGFIEYSLSQEYKLAKPTHAVTLTELIKTDRDQWRNAVVAWDSLTIGQDSITKALATRMRDVLTMKGDLVPLLSDEDKYAFAMYRLTVEDSAAALALVPAIGNDNLKARVLLDLAEKCYAIDKPSDAIMFLQRIAGMELTDPSIGRKMQVLELLAQVQLNGAKDVLDVMKQNPIDFRGKEKKYKVYFDALAAEAAGDSAKANVYYKWLGDNPFFEDGLIAAARYFRSKGTSYNILTEGILYHPSSIRLRKAYALESARIGFEDYAGSALAILQSKLNARDYAELSTQVDELLAKARL